MDPWDWTAAQRLNIMVGTKVVETKSDARTCSLQRLISDKKRAGHTE